MSFDEITNKEAFSEDVCAEFPNSVCIEVKVAHQIAR